MTCRNTFLFIPRNGILCPQFFGIYLFHPLDIAKTESFLGGFAPPATWANHSKVCFELLETFWVTPKDLAINGCISLQS